MIPSTIGDPEKFAFRYIPGYRIIGSNDTVNYYATLHYVINNTLIGNPREECFLNSWLLYTEKNLEKIKNLSSGSYLEKFSSLTDKELFELICKANQIEEHFKPEYNYLPQLNGKLFYKHYINIDETTDGYTLLAVQKNNQIRICTLLCTYSSIFIYNNLYKIN